MPDRLNVAVIGCGGHAQHHFRMIGAEPRLHLTALCELDPTRLEAAAETHGPVRTFDDYRRLLDEVSDLHVVHVTTMPGHLVDIVLDCLDRGLHVHVEKPPGMSSNDTQRMADAAARSTGKAIVSFNRRYMPQILAVRRLAQSAGGAVHVSGTYNKPLTTLGTPAMAGITPDPVVCDALHHVDLIRWLAGDGDTAARPVEVHSIVADGPRDGSHRHNAIVRFEGGAIGQFSSHYGVGARIQQAEVHAEDLSAYLDLSGTPRVELFQAESQPQGTTQTRPDPPRLDLDAVGGEHFDEVQHFTDCIFEDRQPWSTLGDAVHSMRLAEAIRSGHQGALS
ncbi:MAG: Gfo/Idh/MocA family oxidoreductase [Gemmatimonadetes bacterium]|jgi:predicted dehydrogenase|nr:Gfo/Idh/MocA family oxidoreductase [Gemmatimonadota bacterium]MBT7859147.1 Gfo/Idh/MocA family oxidoreductase [Gemmatimonadota bacterium]